MPDARGVETARLAAIYDRSCPGWWETADVTLPDYSEAMVALILDRRLYDRQAMPRPWPDEDELMRDEWHGGLA